MNCVSATPRHRARAHRQRSGRAFAGLLVALALAACQQSAPQPPSAPLAMPPLDTANAALYRLDPKHSVIQLKVYRDGMLSRLGHNHIISALNVEGVIYRRKPLAQSSFELRIPVAAMAVDRPADRKRAGGDFGGTLPQPFIDGTREHMLGPDLLDAGHYPLVVLRSLQLIKGEDATVWEVAVQVRDRISVLQVPLQINTIDGRLIVQGAVTLSQRALGLTPYCVLADKLCVRDDIDAEFYLVAVPAA